MFETIMNFFKKLNKKEQKKGNNHSKEAAKERLHLVLMQDRANVSADFLELMKQEIIEVIKKYIDVDEGAIDVRLTNKENEDGTNGAPALYANIPIVNIKNDANKAEVKEEKPKEEKSIKEDKKEDEDKDKENKEAEEKVEETIKEEALQEDIEEVEEEVEEKEVNEKEEDDESTNSIREIQNERIAKVILEGAMYNKQNDDKKEKE